MIGRNPQHGLAIVLVAVLLGVLIHPLCLLLLLLLVVPV